METDVVGRSRRKIFVTSSDEYMFESGAQQPEESNPEVSVLLSLFNPPVPRPGGGGKGTGVEGPGTFQSPGKLDNEKVVAAIFGSMFLEWRRF